MTFRSEVPAFAGMTRLGALLHRHDPDLDPPVGGALGLGRIVIPRQRLGRAEALGRDPLALDSAGGDVGVTHAPCALCAGALARARIGRLYFAAPDPKGGAILHGPRLFAQPTCHHAPEVYSGMGEAEAGEMLRAFFRKRR